MKKAIDVTLLLSLLVFLPHTKGKRYGPPEKPSMIRCRSPEKETFTCWWEPGSDGGLPTTYALYYRKENSDTVHECPDYRTAGENSCFFNKNDTSIWVNYNITVVATNALGSAFSDPVDIDVAYIVKPNPPERLTVTVMEDKGWPFLRVSWEPPHKADTRSGWITLIYEIRVKLEEEDEWEMHLAGQQKVFNIFSLRSGGTYLVQVRCKPDHGFWSEWSSMSSIKVPDYFHREKSMWILVTVFSALIFLIFMWLLHMNSHSLKHCILPPVPGPKIKGFDNRLLKNGKSEEILSAMAVSAFPPNTPYNCEDLLVEYLEVCVAKDQEPMLEESKDLLGGCPKYESSTSDSDSGRGSCDSQTLLMDKCGEAKEDETQTGQDRMGTEALRHQMMDWEEETLAYAHENTASPDVSSGRVKTWPSVFSPLPQCSSSPLKQQSSLETAKQHYLSDSLLPSGSTPSHLAQPGRSAKEALGLSYWEICSSNGQPPLLHPQTRHLQLQARSDVDISAVGRKQAPAARRSPVPRATESTNVKEAAVLLQPTDSDCGRIDRCPSVPQGQDYSKVKGVDRDNVLLLQREAVEEGRRTREHQETWSGARENRCTASTGTATQKPTACLPSATLGVNGYVDASTLCTLPTY